MFRDPRDQRLIDRPIIDDGLDDDLGGGGAICLPPLMMILLLLILRP